MHQISQNHLPRKVLYHKNLKVSAVFNGDMTEAEKETAENLVVANAVNLNGAVEEINFFDSADTIGEVF